MERKLLAESIVLVYFEKILIFLFLIVGLWFCLIKNIGMDFSGIPGDLGDARFNNYVLEHGYRILSGQEKEIWNAPFFYPFQSTLAFSDNLFGSVPIYSVFRALSMNREDAFQGWILLSFISNYAAAAFVLNQMRFNALAVSAGAFLFTFGLPLLHQDGHPQLFYRFGVPLTFYYCYLFSQKQRLFLLAVAFFWLVWQFYLSIYLGAFLAIMLLVMMALLPMFFTGPIDQKLLNWWPRRMKNAWVQSSNKERLLTLTAFIILSLGLVVLLEPYYVASNAYKFSKTWDDISSMLPRWQSYLLAERTSLWKFSSNILPGMLPMRHEHQLFPGLATVLLILTGVFYRPASPNKKIAWLNLSTVIIIVLMTLYFRGFSLYQSFWWIPGINSIRAVTRIELVLLWPMALFIANVITSIPKNRNKRTLRFQTAIIIFIMLMLFESASFQLSVFTKTEAQERLLTLRSKIPESIQENPVLFVSTREGEPWYKTEIDAMLLSQEMGWPTMNGYSGNFPPGYKLSENCALVNDRVQSYIDYAQIKDKNYFNEMIHRIVPIGFKNCQPGQ